MVSRFQALRQIASWRAQGCRVMVAVGVFDLMQARFAAALREARGPGDRLVVALHDDRSAAALAGPGRPVVAARDRCVVVAALRDVDLVVVVGSDLEALEVGGNATRIDEAWDDPDRDLVARLRAAKDHLV